MIKLILLSVALTTYFKTRFYLFNYMKQILLTKRTISKFTVLSVLIILLSAQKSWGTVYILVSSQKNAPEQPANWTTNGSATGGTPAQTFSPSTTDTFRIPTNVTATFAAATFGTNATLEIVGTGTAKVGSGTLTINGILILTAISTNSISTMAGTTLSFGSGSTIVSYNTNGIISNASGNGNKAAINSSQGTVTLNNSSNYEFRNGASMAGTPTTPTIMNNLTISGTSGSKSSILVATTITNTLLIDTGDTLDLAGFAVSAGVLTGAGTLKNSGTKSTAFTTGSSNTSSTFSGVIQDSIKLTKVGTGTLTLSGANTYTDTTTISVGILKLGNASALGTSGKGTSVASGAALDLAGFTLSSAERLTINGTGVSSGGALTNTGGAASYSGTITLASASNIKAITSGTLTLSGAISLGSNALTIDSSGTGTISGIISGTGTLTKAGAGAWTLSGANTFSGGTTLTAGTLNINHANALGNGSGAFTINGGTIDNTSGASVTTANYPLALNADFTFTGTKGLNLGTNDVTLNADRTITVGADTLKIGGIINDATKSLVKAGNGVLAFGAKAIALNNLTINAGKLVATTDTISLKGNLVNNASFSHNNGTVQLNGSAAAQTISGTSAAGTGFYKLRINTTKGVLASSNIQVDSILHLVTANPSATKGALDIDTLTAILKMGVNSKTTGLGDVTGIINRKHVFITDTAYTFGNQFTSMAFTGSNIKPDSVSLKLVLLKPSWKNTDTTISRYYSIIRDKGTAAVNLRLHYLESELNNISPTATNIDFFDSHSNGATSHDHGHNAESAADNWVELDGRAISYIAPNLSFGEADVKQWGLALSNTPAYTWIGVADTDWTNPTNWSGGVPTSGSDVIIKAATYNPTLSNGNIDINSISISSGAILTASRNTKLNLLATTNSNSVAAWMNDGVFNASTSEVTFSGKNATIGGTSTFYNLSIDNNTSVDPIISLSGGANVTILNTLSIPKGTLSTTGASLILASSDTGTARVIAAGRSAGGYINGNVTVQRYLKTKSAGYAKAYRGLWFVSSPMQDGVSFSESWQKQIHITGVGTGGTPCTSNSAGVQPTVNSNGFDASKGNVTTVYYFDDKKSGSAKWAAISSTINKNNLDSTYLLKAGKGYGILIRGDRNVQGCKLMYNTYPDSASTDVVLSATGKITQGDFDMTPLDTAAGRYNLIGNPYPCELNFQQFANDNGNGVSSGILNKYWVYYPGSQSGNYTTYDNGIFTNAPSSYANKNQIASGQSFFVYNTTKVDTYHFKESQKVNNAHYGFFSVTKAPEWNKMIRIELTDSKSAHLDEVVVRFGDQVQSSNQFDPQWDAKSMNGGAQVIQTLKQGNIALSIQTRNVFFNDDTVNLNIRSASNGEFKLNFSEFKQVQYADIYLIDNYTKTKQYLNENPVYNFSVLTTDLTSLGKDRFVLVFKSKGGFNSFVLTPETETATPVSAEFTVNTYPNPVQNILTIVASNPIQSLRIIDSRGVPVAGQAVELGKNSVTKKIMRNMGNLAEGVYFVQIKDINNKVLVKTIIK